MLQYVCRWRRAGTDELSTHPREEWFEACRRISAIGGGRFDFASCFQCSVACCTILTNQLWQWAIPLGGPFSIGFSKILPRDKPTLIRRALPDDVPTLLSLVVAYWKFEGIDGFDALTVASQLTRLLSDSRLGAGWIAVADGEVVGYLLAVYVFSLEYLGITAEIDELFVAPSQRGRGVGQELLRVAESEFVRAGCTKVSLQLSRGNDAARAFYHRCGYVDRSGYELLDKPLLVDGG